MPEEELPQDATEEVAGAGQAEETETTEAASTTEESFIDPASLPEELKAHWKRMHGTFSRTQAELKAALKEAKGHSAKAEAYDKFWNDPEFMKETVRKIAPQLGINFSDGPNGNGKGVTHAPPEYVETVKAALPPELQWSAQAQADATWAAVQKMVAPVLQRQETASAKEFEREYEALESELEEKVPDWQDHEEEMAELLSFFEDRTKLRHPRFGSKLEALHNLVNGNRAATGEAIRRMQQSAKNKSSVSRPATKTEPNTDELIRKAATPGEAMRLAFEATRRELATKGG